MLNEVAPPGFGHTKGDKKKGVKRGGTAAAFDRARKRGDFKGSKSDMFAIMWSQKNKGDKPHYKPGTDEKKKKYQEETTYKTRDKELKRTSGARNERYKTLHKKTGEGNVDVNEKNEYEKLKKKIGSKKMHKEPVVVGETVDYEGRAKESEKFHSFYKKAKAAKARKQADSTRSDSRIRGVKFSDAKGSGRMRGGKKVYN